MHLCLEVELVISDRRVVFLRKARARMGLLVNFLTPVPARVVILLAGRGDKSKHVRVQFADTVDAVN